MSDGSGRPVPLPAEIWMQILRLVASADRFRFAALLLVSRSWAIYCRPELYRSIRIYTSAQARSLAWTLTNSRQRYLESLGTHVRHLVFSTSSFNRCNSSDVLEIVRHTNQLVSFCDKSSVCNHYDDTVLAKIKTLSSLLWTVYPNTVFLLRKGFLCLTTVHILLSEGSDQFLVNPFALPLLQSLTLTFFDAIVGDAKSPPGRMLELLSLCSLPALRCVAIHTPYVLRDAPAVNWKNLFRSFSQSMAVNLL